MNKGEGSDTGIVALVVILVIVLLIFGTYVFGVWPFERDITINEGDTIVEDNTPDQVNIRDDDPDSTNVNIFPNGVENESSNRASIAGIPPNAH